MSRFLIPRLFSLEAYKPGEQPRGEVLIKLNTNESPFPPASSVLEAITRDEVERLNLYSDPTACILEEAIAAHYGLDRNQVFAGNGSDEVLAFCFQAFCDRVCYPDITYAMYPVLAALYGADALKIPLSDDFRIDPTDYNDVGRTIFLANPNAPTSLYLTPGQIEHILLNNLNSLVVVDEAYIDFGGESVSPLLTKYDNLFIVHTFSKSRNLAGARIGFAMGSKELIDDLRRIKYSFNPYSLNRLSILAGTAAVKEKSYYAECTRVITETRDWAVNELRNRGFMVTDSMTNFLFASPPCLTGLQYLERLRSKGVLVRHFPQPRINNYVRITVGTPEQMRVLFSITDRLLEEACEKQQ